MTFRKRTARGKTLLQKVLRARRAMPLSRHQVNRRQDAPRRIVGPTPSGPGPPFRKLLNDCGVAVSQRQHGLPAHDLKKHM